MTSLGRIYNNNICRVVYFSSFFVSMSLVADYGSSEDDSVDAPGAEDGDQNVESTVRSIAYFGVALAQKIPH